MWVSIKGCGYFAAFFVVFIKEIETKNLKEHGKWTVLQRKKFVAALRLMRGF